MILADGLVEFHEVKGFMRDDARVKFKVAAALYPWFEWVLVVRDGKGWEVTYARRDDT